MVVINLKLIIKAVGYIISFKKLKIPYAKYRGKKSMPKAKIKKILVSQGDFFDKIINNIKLRIVDGSLHVFSADQNNIQKDLIIGHTEKGIHRDDFVLLFNGLNAFDFCSLGQQKMAYLSLVFAYIELFRYKNISYPIVLIDDISGELDRCRWGRLVDFLQQKEFQVLITTANEEFRKELERIDGAKKFFVKKGEIKTIQ